MNSKKFFEMIVQGQWLLDDTDVLSGMVLTDQNHFGVPNFFGRPIPFQMQLFNEKLKQNFSDKENVKVGNIVDDIDLIDDAISLKETLSTPYRRDKFLKTKFDFITPERKVIKTVEGVEYFYYSMPVDKILSRFITDDSLRCGIFGFASPLVPSKREKNKKNETT